MVKLSSFLVNLKNTKEVVKYSSSETVIIQILSKTACSGLTVATLYMLSYTLNGWCPLKLICHSPLQLDRVYDLI